MTEIKLKVENLTKTFGDEVAVNNVSFQVEEGQLKSLLGPSGCGKTTTLRCIAGLETPDSGRIYIGDELVSAPEQDINYPPKNRGIGMVFQSYAIWPHMTVRENVSFPLEYKRKDLSKAERNEKVEAILEDVGLGRYVDDLAAQLSGGQQQRVALSRALVVEPEMLLMDEPLSSLDAKLRREMRKDLQEIYREFNITVLYVTHAQDEAMFLSDEIAIMNNGRIIEESTPEQLYKHPTSFFSMNFMGRSNSLRGKISAIDETQISIDTSIGEIICTDRMADLEVGDTVDVSFRPKYCTLLDLDGNPIISSVDSASSPVPIGGEGTLGTAFDGEILSAGATRDFTEYEVKIGDVQVQARSGDPLPVQIGDRVQLFVPAEFVRVFHPEDRTEASSQSLLTGSPAQ